jgi:ABC-2 type transport system ATP-binding protein
LLTTLLQPTGGTLELDGLNPMVQPTEVRRRFGVVFQDPSLDQDLTAWENLDILFRRHAAPPRDRARPVAHAESVVPR